MEKETRDEIILYDGTKIFIDSDWIKTYCRKKVLKDRPDIGTDNKKAVDDAVGDMIAQMSLFSKGTSIMGMLRAALNDRDKSGIASDRSLRHVTVIAQRSAPIPPEENGEISDALKKEILRDAFDAILWASEAGAAEMRKNFDTTEIPKLLKGDPLNFVTKVNGLRMKTDTEKVRALAGEIGYAKLFDIISGLADEYCKFIPGKK